MKNDRSSHEGRFFVLCGKHCRRILPLPTGVLSCLSENFPTRALVGENKRPFLYYDRRACVILSKRRSLESNPKGDAEHRNLKPGKYLCTSVLIQKYQEIKSFGTPCRSFLARIFTNQETLSTFLLACRFKPHTPRPRHSLCQTFSSSGHKNCFRLQGSDAPFAPTDRCSILLKRKLSYEGVSRSKNDRESSRRVSFTVLISSLVHFFCIKTEEMNS